MFDAAPHDDHALMQDPAFAAALRACGQQVMRLPGGQAILHRRVMGVPLAMLPRAAPPEDLDDQLRQLGVGHRPLILSPDHPCPMPRSICLRRAQDLIVLDLDADNKSARARLHPKWRNQLTAAEKRPIHVVHGPLSPDPAQPLLQLESAQARMRGYANWPAALTAAFARVAPDQTLHFTAGYKDRVLAHLVFLLHGCRATYHIGYITAEGRQMSAHNVLMWHATRHLASLRIRSVELGLVQANTPGLTRFKLRTGARRAPTGGTWLYWRPLKLRRPQPSPT